MLVQPLREPAQTSRSDARSSRRRLPGCTGRAPSRNRDRTARSPRRSRRRAGSRTRSGRSSRPASRACSRPPSPPARRPARTGRRPGCRQNSFGAPSDDRTLEALPDQPLRAGHVRDVADHLLERAAVVEREDVETLVISELVQSDLTHQYSLPVRCVELGQLVSRLDPANRAGPRAHDDRVGDRAVADVADAAQERAGRDAGRGDEDVVAARRGRRS